MKSIIVVGQPNYFEAVGGSITMFDYFCNNLSLNYKVYALIYSKNKNKTISLNKNVTFINLHFINNHHTFESSINYVVAKINPSLIVYFFAADFVGSNLKAKYSKIPKLIMFHSRPDYYFKIDNVSINKLLKYNDNNFYQILFDSYYNLIPKKIRNENIFTIPNGIHISNNHINPKNEKKKIVYLSRIDTWKGLEFLIKSFKLISSKYFDWSIDIFGYAESKIYVKYLEKLCKMHHVDNQIKFLGISKNPINTLLKYDFCVFPSLFEGFSIGLLQALSVGLPSIGLETATGVNEMIIDGYNGFLSKNNCKDFSHKIEKLIVNKDLRISLSKNSINYAKKYSIENINKMWLDNINNIIENKKILFKSKTNKFKNNLSIKKISKLRFGRVKLFYLKAYMNKQPKKMFLLMLHFFLKLLIPDGSKRQSFVFKNKK